MDWQPTRNGYVTTHGATTISVDRLPGLVAGKVVWSFYACTVIDPKHSRVHSSPVPFYTPEAAKIGAQKWMEKQP